MNLKKLWYSGAVIAIGVLLGRLAGFFREATLAAKLGVTQNADVAVALLSLPDVFINLLVGGAMAAALVPSFKRLDHHEKQVLFLQSSLLSIGIFSLLAIILSVTSQYWLRLLAPGVPNSAINSLIKHAIWMLPLTAAAGVSTAYLQAQEKFFIPALGTLIFNLTIIYGLLAADNTTAMLSLLPTTILIGAALRWGSQLNCLNWQALISNLGHKLLIDLALFKRYWQAMFAAGLLFLLPPIAAALASTYGPGQMAAFNYANKLVQLPVGMCLSIFSVVLLPKFSEQFASGNKVAAIDLLRKSVLLIFILSFAIVSAAIVAAPDLVTLIFGRGAVTTVQIQHISVMFQFLLLSLPAQGISSLLLSFYNAYQDTRTPFYISLFGVTGFIVLVCSLPSLNMPLIAALFALTYWLIALLQIWQLHKRHQIVLWTQYFRTGLTRLSLIMSFGLVIWLACYRILPNKLWWHLAAMSIFFIAVLAASALTARSKELNA